MNIRKYFYRILQVLIAAVFVMGGGFSSVSKTCQMTGLACYGLCLLWKYVCVYVFLLFLMALDLLYRRGETKREIFENK